MLDHLILRTKYDLLDGLQILWLESFNTFFELFLLKEGYSMFEFILIILVSFARSLTIFMDENMEILSCLFENFMSELLETFYF